MKTELKEDAVHQFEWYREEFIISPSQCETGSFF